MAVVNIDEARTQFSQLLERVAAGEEVLITKAGTPVAKLIPVQDGAGTGTAKTKRQLGILAGKMSIPDDFDAPLPDDILEAFEAPLFPDESEVPGKG